MKQELRDIVTEATETFVGDIRVNLANSGTDATQESSQSIHYEIKDFGAQGFDIEVLAKPFFAVVETGRKPTPEKKPSRDMLDNLFAWLKARSKPDNLLWAIAMSIQKKGTKLWQRGGRKDIYSNLKEPFVKEIGDKAAEFYADELLLKL